MNYDKELKSAQPRWLSDGGGLRGNAPVDFPASRQDLGTGKPAFESASIVQDVPAVVSESSGMPFASAGISYPWIDSFKATSTAWGVTFGESASMKRWAATVMDPVSDTASQMFLQVGGADGSGDASTDLLQFNFGAGNSATLTWSNTDNGPEFELDDTYGNQSHLLAAWLQIGDTEEGAFNGVVWLGRGSDSTWHLEIADSTAYVKLGDSIGAPTGSAPVYLGADDGFATWHLTIADDYAYVCLGESEPFVFLGRGSDSTWHLEIADDTAYINLNDSVWLGFSSLDGTWHLEISEDGAYVKLGTNSYVELGDGSEIWLGYGSDGTWHLEVDDSGYVQVGEAKMSDGDLDLGSDPSISVTGYTAAGWPSGGYFHPQQFTVCISGVNNTVWLWATDPVPS